MFLCILLYYLLKINLKRDEKNVNDNVLACVAEVNSRDLVSRPSLVVV